MIWQPEDLQVQKIKTRACLKKAFRELRVPVCGRFYPNEGGVAGYGNRMWAKYTAKWGSQIAEMIFQTRSRTEASVICQSRCFPFCITYQYLNIASAFYARERAGISAAYSTGAANGDYDGIQMRYEENI